MIFGNRAFTGSQWIGALAITLSLTLAGCKGDPLKDFVEVEVKLDASASKDGSAGTLVFKETYYTTGYHRVCDYYECGGYEDRCWGGEERCSGGHQVCTGGGEVCTPVTRCTAQGCTEDSVCRTTSESCYWTGETCHRTNETCSREWVNRSCPTNCRQESYQVPHTRKVPSKITVEVKGIDNPADVKDLRLAVNTNSRFIQAFDHPTTRPEGFGYLWDSLSRDQKTLIIANVKGYKLVQSQNFLNLPPNFKRGDDFKLEIQFERSSDERTVSAAGTTVQLPSLSFEQ